jgi:hypothetical protein
MVGESRDQQGRGRTGEFPSLACGLKETGVDVSENKVMGLWLCAGRLLSFLALILLGLPIPYAQSNGEEEEKRGPGGGMERPAMPAFVQGEFIVKLKEGVNSLSSEELQPLELEDTSRRTSGGEVIYQFTPEAMARLETLSEQERMDKVSAVIEKLQANPKVEYAQLNKLLQPFILP